MNQDTIIKIARAVRNYSDSIGEVTLVWKVFYSKFSIEYREVSARDNLYLTSSTTTPDPCVKAWLRTFVRDQRQLKPDSYYLIEPPTEMWREVIEGILKQC